MCNDKNIVDTFCLNKDNYKIVSTQLRRDKFFVEFVQLVDVSEAIINTAHLSHAGSVG